MTIFNVSRLTAADAQAFGESQERIACLCVRRDGGGGGGVGVGGGGGGYDHNDGDNCSVQQESGVSGVSAPASTAFERETHFRHEGLRLLSGNNVIVAARDGVFVHVHASECSAIYTYI